MPVVLLGSLAATAYFACHVVGGTHGLLAQHRLMERSTEVEREIASLEVVRSRLKRDVTLLAEQPPDPDIVEEVARDVLGLVRPGDQILIDRR